MSGIAILGLWSLHTPNYISRRSAQSVQLFCAFSLTHVETGPSGLRGQMLKVLVWLPHSRAQNAVDAAEATS